MMQLNTEFDPKDKDKVVCMESLLHAADVSNPFKPFSIYEKWTYRVLAEFWD
jgi:cAMP-specific phosphodiesterase 4/calcium/calmodulin-dependent 3',5'-cyclic nucleotide phosphodiesterase